MISAPKIIKATMEDGSIIELRYGEWQDLELKIIELDCGYDASCNKEFMPISALKNLKKLVLNASEVNNLSFVESLQSLEELECVVNSIIDISPLKSLVQLKKLDLGDNLIENISPLENLTNLEVLFISDNSVKSLAPIKKLKNLKHIDFLYQSPFITDLTPLESIKNLKIEVGSGLSSMPVFYNEIKKYVKEHKKIKGLTDGNCKI